MDYSSLKLGLFCIVLSLFGCAEKPAESQGKAESVSAETVTQTDVLAWYLDQTFSEKLPVGNAYFVFVPSASCKGCKGGAIQQLADDIPAHIATQTTFITVDSDGIPKALHKKMRVLIDSKKRMDNLRLPIANFTVVVLAAGKIKAINSLKTTDQNGILHLFNSQIAQH